jgi:hypothetical protein
LNVIERVVSPGNTRRRKSGYPIIVSQKNRQHR